MIVEMLTVFFPIQKLRSNKGEPHLTNMFLFFFVNLSNVTFTS